MQRWMGSYSYWYILVIDLEIIYYCVGISWIELLNWQIEIDWTHWLRRETKLVRFNDFKILELFLELRRDKLQSNIKLVFKLRRDKFHQNYIPIFPVANGDAFKCTSCGFQINLIKRWKTFRILKISIWLI